MKTKPKRLKQWVNVCDDEPGLGHPSAKMARLWSKSAGATRVAVPLIELRRGEVVVDVEALVEAIDQVFLLQDTEEDELRAAIKRVGVR